MKINLKIFLVGTLIAVLLISLSFVGCKEKAAPAEGVTEEVAEEEAAPTEEEAEEAETTAEENIVITSLCTNLFVPAADTVLDSIVKEWAKSKGITAFSEHISGDQLASKISSELNMGSGHDIVEVEIGNSFIYGDLLSDVGSLVSEIEAQSGNVLPVGKSMAYVDGVWRAVPFFHQSFPILYRKDYCEAVGYDTEKMNSLTMDTFLDLAKKLAETGHMVGIPVSNTNDAKSILPPILWGFGGSLFGENNEITVNSPETKKALEYVAELCKYMPSEVTGWDSAANNLFMLSGEGAVTANPPSVYAAAISSKLDFADQLFCGPFPKGEFGSYRLTFAFNLAIPEYCTPIEKELAADLIKYILQRENFVNMTTAAQGYSQPLYEGLQNVPIWSENPNLTGYEPAIEDNLFVNGWPGPLAYPTAYTVRADLEGILPNMFSKVASGEATPDEAMVWAQGELERIVREESE